jgi:DNA primase catalytic core
LTLEAFMPRIPEDELARLKTGVSLVRLIEASGVKLEKRGRDFVGRCPFHDDRTPSLVVSPEKNLWNCLGACGAGGDVIAFVMKAEGVSFRHAVELLQNDYEPAAADKPVVKSTVQKLEPLKAEREDAALLTQVIDYYHETLKTSPDALAYLKKRGIADAEMIERFKLGLANRTLGYRLPAKNRQAGADLRGRLQKIGILRESGHEHFAGSLVIPVIDERGAVKEAYGRKLLDNLRPGTPKHLYLPGPHHGVFNAEAFKASDEIILCEALIDALTFWAAGYRNVTAAYGVNGFTDEILEAFKAHGIKRALIAFDRDAAGDAAAKTVAETLMAAGVECWRILFPKGMDANAYALAVTPPTKSLAALIRAAQWMGKGEKPRNSVTISTPEPAASPEEAAKEERSVGAQSPLAAHPEPAASDAAEVEAPIEPPDIPEPAASPAPPPPPAVAAEVAEHEVTFNFADRHWRVRGLAKNMSYETLRVNVLARRGEAFHVDGFDLYNAKHRASFVAQAAGELGLPADAIKGDLGRVLLKLEELQDEQIRAALAPTGHCIEVSEADRLAALAFLKGPDLLTRIADDVESCGIVGERANVLAAYLACISRKLDKPLAVLIQSTSAAGKSALMDAVLDFVPGEERVQYAAMTGQALFYLGETAVKHKVLAIAEEEGAREASYALKLLQSQGDLSIASTGKDPVTGKLITQDYRVEGPVALMMTTTAIDLDEELKNRCLVLCVNETRAQTAAIHRRQRFEETLEGLLASENRAAIVARHQNAQRLLRPLRVVNPYAEQLTFLDDKTQHRRDHKKYLALIRAIALLCQHQRPVKNAAGSTGEAVEYIEATLDDIAAANALAHEVLGRTLDELPPQTRALLTIIHEMVREACKKADMRQGDYRFTRRDVREASGWGHTQLRVHLSRLAELEYLIPHRGARGSRFLYELAYEGAGDHGDPFMMGLIDVERLRDNDEAARELHRYDGKLAGAEHDLAGLEAQLAGSKRPQNGGMTGPSRGAENANNDALSDACEDVRENAPENAHRSRKNPPASYANGAVSAALETA